MSRVEISNHITVINRTVPTELLRNGDEIELTVVMYEEPEGHCVIECISRKLTPLLKELTTGI